jgi:hypothetical protein
VLGLPALSPSERTAAPIPWDATGSLCRECRGYATAVCSEILNSGVVVMESAKDGARIDDTGSLNRARDRRILVQ